MIGDVSPGVVQIITASGTGSGFIIDEDGLVVTNAHVVQGFKTVDVTLAGGQWYQADVLGVDVDTDLALLDLRDPMAIEPVTLGDSDTVAVGEEVIAMGFPLGGNDILIGSPSVTGGIVSAKRVSELGVELLQTDAAINPGNSGGPLFGRDGRVVGVNTAKVFESGDGRPVEGIGLAVAINEVRDRLDLLARGGDVIAPTATQSATERAPTPVPGGAFVSVSAGGLHSCSLISDGSVSCWGSNEDLDGNIVGQSTPPAGFFASVSSGLLHSCGVKTNGSIVCWGSNEDGEAAPPEGSFTSVSTEVSHSCGVKTDGSVACWGLDKVGQSTPPAGSFVFRQCRGAPHSCGVKTDGSVACWGANVNADGGYIGQSTPPTGSFTLVSAGGLHSCGVKTDGSVVCWGSNEDVHGYFAGQSTAPDGVFSTVSAGTFHSCGVRTDGTIVCWGDNQDGQSTAPSGSFVSVSAGTFHSCGVRTDGSVVCWGDDSKGQSSPHGGPLADPFVSVSAGSEHTCGVMAEGAVVCWGNDFSGEATPPSGSFASVSAGVGHTCGVRTEGSVVCWGSNTHGEATPPDGSFFSASAGFFIAAVRKQTTLSYAGARIHTGAATPPDGSFFSVSANAIHSCGVKMDASVACWGSNVTPRGNYTGQAISPAGFLRFRQHGSNSFLWPEDGWLSRMLGRKRQLRWRVRWPSYAAQ